MNDTTRAERKAFLTGLRNFADFMESHPDMPLGWYGVTFSHWSMSREELTAIIRQLGSVTKNFESSYIEVKKDFGGNVKYEVNIHRDQVCERVVIGTRTVPASTSPERVEDIVEWRCSDTAFLAPRATEEEDGK